MSDQITCEEVHRQARERWPELDWPLEQYLDHSNGQPPLHKLDHYLAGAAGHRLDEAWRLIHVELKDKAIGTLTTKFRKSRQLDITIDDLWQEAVANTMQDEQDREAWPDLPDGRRPSKLIKWRGDSKLLNYYIKVAVNVALDRLRKHKPVSENALQQPGDDGRGGHSPVSDQASDTPRPDEMAASNEAAQTIRACMAKVIAMTPAEVQTLLQLVRVQGMQQKDAGATLTPPWTPSRVTRALQRFEEQVRACIREQADDEA